MLTVLTNLSGASEDFPPDKTGFMWGLIYGMAKVECGTLPDDLEADYSKSIRLLSEASSTFAPTYQEGLISGQRKPDPKVRPPVSAETLEARCNQDQHNLRMAVMVARGWFRDVW